MSVVWESGLGRKLPYARSVAGDATALTPCMPCSFGVLPHRRSGTGAQRNDLLRVTVTVRWIPLVTAAYGTRVARRARTTRLAPVGDGSSSAGLGGPTLRPCAPDLRARR
jgi:hypothetical protein